MLAKTSAVTLRAGDDVKLLQVRIGGAKGSASRWRLHSLSGPGAGAAHLTPLAAGSFYVVFAA